MDLDPRYQKTQFLTSAALVSQFSQDTGREVAFAGRSNSGKSSAINVLCQQKGLAHTSKSPGRTRLINFFVLDTERRLVDLPGYGYAEVSEAQRQHWRELISDYLRRRQSLRGIVLMMDVRHPLTEVDRLLLEWNKVHHIPTHILLTKADKLSRGAALNTLAALRRELAVAYPTGVGAQLFSSLQRTGLDEAYAQLNLWLGMEPLLGG